MWYLLAAVIGSSSLVVILKVFDLKGVNLYAGITVNYVVAALLSLAFAPAGMSAVEITSAPWFAISLVIGALFMLSFVVYALSAQASGVAVTTISGRAAVVIPVVFAFLFFGEKPTWAKIALLAVILAAMLMILKKRGAGNGERKRFTGIALFILPIGVFLFNGVNDTLVQYAQREMIPSADLYPLFNGVMFIAGAFTGLVCYNLAGIRRKQVSGWGDLAWGSLLGVMNWICMTGVVNGLNYMDGSVFYPLYYTGAILIATIAGVWIFRERLSPLNYAGIVLAVGAIAVLSMI
ncbi:MAG: DMT family transporter [Rikenellaceae bacterium]|nr:DMT family transporter [Rikenellaceae bacterium]